MDGACEVPVRGHGLAGKPGVGLCNRCIRGGENRASPLDVRGPWFFVARMSFATLEGRRDSVTRQADRIARSGAFGASGRLIRLFRYTLSESLAGRGSLINQFSIAFDVFHLKEDFDPSSNATVRVHATKLRRALRAYYAGEGVGDAVMIEMLPGSYALAFSVKTAPRCEAPGSGEHRPVVAMVEFQSIGLEPPWTRFPLLFAEELSVLLSKVTVLRVMGPLSRQLLLNEGVEVVALSARYPADFIIDGSVQMHEGGLVLRVRLLEGGRGCQVWSRKYDCGNAHSDFAGIETDLMERLALEVGADFGVMDTHLTALAKVKAINQLSVHEALLTARGFFEDYSEESYLRGVEALRGAILAAPEEALPHATLAMLMVSAFNEKFCSHGQPPVQIDYHAARAATLEPGNAWSTIALLCAAGIHRRGEELARIAGVIDADPGSSKLLRLVAGIWLVYQKSGVELGHRFIREAMADNPHYPRVVHLCLSLRLIELGDWDGAADEIRRFPLQDYWCVWMIDTVIAVGRGEMTAARAQWDEVLRLYPEFPRRGFRHLRRLWHEDYARLIVTTLRLAGIRIAAR